MLNVESPTSSSLGPAATPPSHVRARTGIWFVGARGSVATTATVGLLAVQRGLAPTDGLVSELPDVAAADLAPLADLVVGGHDVATHTVAEQAAHLARSGVLPFGLPEQLAAELADVEGRIRPGIGAGVPQREAADRLIADLAAFRDEHGLDRVVVVDVSSTEPPVTPSPALDDLATLEAELDGGGSPLPLSSLYAYAAFRAGCPLAAFTPSTGPACGALDALARELGLPWAGRDGKTGETLVKSALAPLFGRRALRVNSWTAMNILGGGDGQTLSDPEAAKSKTTTKGLTVSEILGYPVEGPVRIDYVADQGDWKTAWDHISFSGFLGTRMTMQFTWQGADSALAAPLVLDLVRLLDRAHEAGQAGPLAALGFFFKEPLAGTTHALDEQWHTLVDWIGELPARRTTAGAASAPAPTAQPVQPEQPMQPTP
ncbi:inositol-3-phosphate synthase [Litorihabitans aurantiacus]|uniref:Myo-inositol-1-phosphate synthase n=1 Tax=Litorihabitans aurantiacus TaxID=1930061 RepID=A0AA38CRQ3_9MICO|nr:inositol-3-phosphate synthase [Litorihabitans aurantiacus]GMA32978.1 myo-inositol-1-phosphate synthase [Litorihabitans aurantiacus]